MTTPSLAPLPAQLTDPGTLAAGPASRPGFASLDERILAVERRLITREENLHRRFQAMSQRVSQATQPRRLAVPLLGAAAAGLALWWVARRALPAHGVRPGNERAAGRPATAPLPWIRLLGLAWPLLPQAWRSRVNPSVASLVIGVGLPMAEHLWQRAQRRPGGPMGSNE